MMMMTQSVLSETSTLYHRTKLASIFYCIVVQQLRIIVNLFLDEHMMH